MELTCDLAIPFLGMYPEKNHNSKRYMHPSAHCSTVYNSQDRETISAQYLSAEKCIKKKWYISTMEYYFAIKRTKECHWQQNGWT